MTHQAIASAAAFEMWRVAMGHTSTQETADALGVTRRMVEMYRAGSRPVSPTVVRLCAALHQISVLRRFADCQPIDTFDFPG